MNDSGDMRGMTAEQVRNVAARFHPKVGEADARGCRVWTAATHPLGYGEFRMAGRIEAAHRVAFWLHHGRWPVGQVRHTCDVRGCCEPAHLIEGSHQQNMQDAADRGRMRTSRPGNGRAKLAPEAREEIKARFAAGEINKSALAREYGITPTRVRQVVNG